VTETIRKAWTFCAWFLVAAVSFPLTLTAIFAPDPTTKTTVWLIALVLWPGLVSLVYGLGLWLVRKTLVGRAITKAFATFVG